MLVRIKERSWLAQVAAKKLKAQKVAIVFGSTIHLHNTTRDEFLADQRWVCHELKHVAQFRQHGFAVFLLKYLWESARRGYYHNRFEKEARASEEDSSLAERFRFY